MKNLILTFLAAFFLVGTIAAQDAQTVKLSQTTGKFEETMLTLSPGDYVFEVSNEDVDHAVGFVLVPEGATEQKDHIKAAYLKKTIKEGETATSSVVSLEAGTYEYFCPMNPTPHYKLIVK